MFRRAVKRAWQTYTRQLPDMLQYTLLTLVIHVMPIVPLLILLDLSLWPVLLLTPALYVLAVLPMRQNAAQMMQRSLHGGRIFGAGLVSFADYGQKLVAGLKRVLLLMLWALPALAATGWAIWLYSREGVHGSTDIITLLTPVKQLGGNDVIRGIVYVLLIYLSLWLPLVVGCACHSGARHARALGNQRLLRGHRGGQMLTWLVSLVTMLPWFIALGAAAASYVPQMMNAINRYEFSGLVPGKGMLIGLAAATLLLLVPALPLRDLIIAAYPACIHDETEADA